jgi:hypothetical protein
MTATASVSYYFKGTIVEDRAYFDFTLMLHQFKEAGFLLHELDKYIVRIHSEVDLPDKGTKILRTKLF